MFWENNKKTFFVLWLACIVSSIIQTSLFLVNGLAGDLTLSKVLLENLFPVPIYGAIIFVGLWLAYKAGFCIAAPKGDLIRLILKPAFIVGTISASILFPIFLLIMSTTEMAAVTGHNLFSTPLNAFFLAITSGILGEIMFRLFLMTLLVWLKRKCFSIVHDDRFAVWVGIVLAGILFGVAHLPIIPALGLALTMSLVTKVIIINAVFGIIFGYMYWRYSLVTAILTHVVFDIVTYAIIRPLYLWLF